VRLDAPQRRRLAVQTCMKPAARPCCTCSAERRRSSFGRSDAVSWHKPAKTRRRDVRIEGTKVKPKSMRSAPGDRSLRRLQSACVARTASASPTVMASSAPPGEP